MSTENIEKPMVEVPDAPKAEENAPPTLADLADAGFAPQEIEMAKKHGLTKTEGAANGTDANDGSGDAGKDRGAEAGGEGGGSDGGIKATEGTGDGKTKEKAKTVDERYRILAEGRSPEAIIEEMAGRGDLTPEQETVLVASLTNNGKTLYWAQKKARLRAQKAEAEAADRAKELEALRAENAELKKRPAAPVDDLLDPEAEPEIDPKKKPLTMEDLERIEAEKQAKLEEDSKKRTTASESIKEALNLQHEEAKERYQDFDAAMSLAAEILDRANKGTLGDLYKDSRQQTRIILKAKTLLTAFANADKFGSDQFNPADMAYELGREHPEYGKKKPEANGSPNGETAVDGNPEDVERAVKNASRRGSSATLNGGGSRRVALDDLTPEQAARLPDAQFRKLPKATRERLLAS